MLRVVVVSPGSFVSVRRGKLVIRPSRKSEVMEFPVAEVDEVLISGAGVTMVSKALYELVRQGIPIYIVSGGGFAEAMVWPSVPNRTVETRRLQYTLYASGEGLKYSVELVRGKVWNKAWLLKYLARSRRSDSLRECGYRVEEFISDLRRCSTPSCVMDVEAAASRIYWECFSKYVIPPEHGFSCRDQEGSDPVNVALNYGYGILRLKCMKALLTVGLDPYAGFLHVDKSGRPSLVLDFMEQFRFAVDKAVAEASLRKSFLEADGGMLTQESRKWVADLVLKELEERSYWHRSSRKSLDKVIKASAADLAHSIRSGDEFIPFLVRW